MRHNKKSGMKLGTDASHTKAMKRGLVCSLLANDRIKTTLPRAKAIRGNVDRVITWAKKGDLHSRRLAIQKIGDAEIVREVFEKAAQGMWAGRDGGYTRIMRLGKRKGDNAEVVIIEMVNEAPTPKKSAGKTEVKPVKKTDKKKDEPKATEESKATEEVATEDVPEATEAVEEAVEAAAEPEDAPVEAAEEAASETTEVEAETAEAAEEASQDAE